MSDHVLAEKCLLRIKAFFCLRRTSFRLSLYLKGVCWFLSEVNTGFELMTVLSVETGVFSRVFSQVFLMLFGVSVLAKVIDVYL